VVVSTGRRSERFAQRLWPQWPEEGFVQIGDFFEKSLELAAQKGFGRVVLAVFFGKALKMAQGAPQTHAAHSALSLNTLAGWAIGQTGDQGLAEKIRRCNTAREAFLLIYPGQPTLLAEVGKRILSAAGRFAGRGVKIQSVIFDYEGHVAFDSEKVFKV
jgi:cobalt-precorrin-5B (C1)-methyltransferase